MILLDTNILIEFYKNNARVTQELRQIGQPDFRFIPHIRLYTPVTI